MEYKEYQKNYYNKHKERLRFYQKQLRNNKKEKEDIKQKTLYWAKIIDKDIPWRFIDEDKFFTKEDIEYIKSIPNYEQNTTTSSR